MNIHTKKKYTRTRAYIISIQMSASECLMNASINKNVNNKEPYIYNTSFTKNLLYSLNCV